MQPVPTEVQPPPRTLWMDANVLVTFMGDPGRTLSFVDAKGRGRLPYTPRRGAFAST